MKNPKIITAISALENHIIGECSAIDVEEQYKEMIDEIYSFSSVGGPFESMSPAEVLKQQDETAYRCGMNDYTNSRCSDSEWIEVGDEYFEPADVEDEKESFISEYEAELRGQGMPEEEIAEIIAALEGHEF